MYARRNLGTVAPVYYDFVIAGMQRAGAIAVEEAEFLQRSVDRNDIVIGFFVTNEMSKHVYGRVHPEHRWMFLVDTKINDDDGTGAYQGKIEYAHERGIRNALITYPIAPYTRRLHKAGISTVVMPCCAPNRRPRIDKYNGVAMTGTYDAKVYPTRWRLGALFRDRLPGIAGLPVPRGTTPASAPLLKGEAYYQMLDGCNMAIVCKGGLRDCLVAKYVEFGMCHALPIGDCPSYMPDDMKRLMLNVEGQSDDAVVAEVRRLLASPEELYARQEAYSELTHHYFDLETNARRALNEIAGRP